MGIYDWQAAKRIDDVLKMAFDAGIYVVLSLNTFSDLSTRKDRNGLWEKSPYNAANGGPCQTTMDWFRNPVAMDFVTERYKYIVSRFGAFANVFSFEHFNEVDLVDGFNNTIVEKWHLEMTQRVRKFDTNHRMITTSYATTPIMTTYAFLDYTQEHRYYWPNDIPMQIAQDCSSLENAVPHPVMIGEYGITSQGALLDPKGERE